MADRIRLARPGDEQTLAHIQTESWKAAFCDILPRDVMEKYTEIEFVTKIYRKLLETGKGNGYILELDGEAHGIAWWDAARAEDMPDTAELICIHSLPGNWRKGYGSKLMDRCLKDMAAAGYTRVMLWVFEENRRARAFYEAMGFAATGRSQPAFGAAEMCYEKKAARPE